MQRYKPLQASKKPDSKRPRRSAHSSKLPYWLAKRPVVQKFMRLSRRRKIMLVAWSGASALTVIALITTVYFANTLSSKERIMNRNKTGVVLLDRNGKEYYRFYNARTDRHVSLSKISKYAQQAAIASEDKDFYDHAGFSPKGIAGAVWQNIKPSGSDGGGSTITQQLVASSLLDKRRSYLRKYQELILSIEIERRYSKDEILEMYLNSVYFGEGSFGIEDAARTYFDKSAKDLTLSEASMLIGLLPAPSVYSPITGSEEKAEIRQTYVLGRMQSDGYITEQEAKAADSKKLAYEDPKEDTSDFKAPHFALMVKDELEKKYGEEEIARSGFRVATSLDLSWQAIAEKAVKNQIDASSYGNVSNGAAVIIDPKTGQIRAVVGSYDWNDKKYGKFNIATATRQPGSSFKPIVYSTGIENRDFTAATLWDDKATDFNGYKPNNYDFAFRGKVTTRNALGASLNIPAVLALQKTGISETIDQAKKLGITTLDEKADYGLPMALGSAPANLTEMTNVYATFANQGKLNDKTTVGSIKDKNGKTIYEDKQENKQAISSQTSYIMSSMLSDNVARAPTFGSSLNLFDGRLAAVKTGTTEDYRDGWTIGYTPSLAVGVWVGNNDNSEMTFGGSAGAGPIWRTIMTEVLAGTPHETFSQPDGLTSRAICRGNGALADRTGGNTITEYFLPGTLPTAHCNTQSERQQQPSTPPRQDETEDEDEDSEEEEIPVEPTDPEDEETTPPTEPTDPIDPITP